MKKMYAEECAKNGVTVNKKLKITDTKFSSVRQFRTDAFFQRVAVNVMCHGDILVH